MVAGYQVSQTGSTTNSPFDLPAASADSEKQSHAKSFDDKLGAEHRASLVTFGVLSVVYVALQFIALWLAMVYGFAGLSSKDAYETTSKFKTASEMVRWMERQRLAIRGHANHKLRLLQKKVSGYDMATDSGEESSNSAHTRDFDAFLKMNAVKVEADRRDKKAKADQKALDDHRDSLELQRRKDSIDVEYKSPATQISVTPQVVAEAPERVVQLPEAAPNTDEPQKAPVMAAQVKPGDFDDLRGVDDEEIQHLVDVYGLPFDELKRIKAAQITLAKVGKFPAKKVVTA